MTQSVARASLIERAPQWRTESLIAILSMAFDERLISPPPKIGKHEVLCAVARQVGVSPHDIHGPFRNGDVITARMLYYVVARRFTHCSTVDIARFVSRDHTCVLNACDKVKQHPERYEPHLSKLISFFEARVSQPAEEAQPHG